MKSTNDIANNYPIQDGVWPSRKWNKEMTEYIDLSGGEGFKKVVATNWGETITITNHDDIFCRINVLGNSNSGLPSEKDSKQAKLICEAVNNYQSLKDYTVYVESKIDINEMPLTFGEWQEFNEYGKQ